LQTTEVAKVRIGNGDCIAARGKGILKPSKSIQTNYLELSTR